ncbi:MAG TPA: tetratricopeptide repeat protein, partial [Sphingomicrobium sp.]
PLYSNLGQAYLTLGREQEAVDAFRRAARVQDSREYDARLAVQLTCAMKGGAAGSIPDPKADFEAADCLSSVNTAIAAQQAVLNRMNSRLYRHDPWFDVNVPPLPDDTPAETLFRTAIGRLRAQVVGGGGAALAQALATYDRLLAERLKPGPKEPATRTAFRTNGRPLRARALALLGHLPEAEAMIQPSPLNCYECLRVRGFIAERQGDAPAAQRWYAQAVRQGPRLARAYVDWARLLASQRRFAGAERRYARAAELAPNWADPHRYWGDALAAQGKRKAALTHYDAALKLAPRWAELRAVRAKLLKH